MAAETPTEAIRLARNHSGKINLLLTDVVMPEMNGLDLAKNILSFYPNLKLLFMSGYTANIIAKHGILNKGLNFMQKPFSRQTLGSKVRQALDED
jgi:YesN/AraC family two-component response regulator